MANAGMVVGAFVFGEEVDEIADLPPTGFDVSWLGSSQQMFELGEDLFNRIEVWTVGRQ
jgi:hypothetical protein